MELHSIELQHILFSYFFHTVPILKFFQKALLFFMCAAVFYLTIHNSQPSPSEITKISSNTNQCSAGSPVLHGEYSENREKESMAVKQVPTGSIRRLLMEK